MGKGKKGGKRMNKAQLTEKLQEFFASQPGVTLSFKEIFRGLHLTTHSPDFDYASPIFIDYFC
jgi:ribonuclease R